MNSLRTLSALAFGVIFIVVVVNTYAQSTQIVSIKQLSDEYGFEYSGSQPINLSGIAVYQDRIFIVGDKSPDRHLYEVREDSTHWRIVSRIELQFKSRSELEGVFSSTHGLFLVNESSQRVYRYDFDGQDAVRQPLSVRFPNQLRSNSWGNAGLEGVAYDVVSNHLYLAKERDPPLIIVYRLSLTDGSSQLVKQFGIPSPDSTSDGQSFSDLYFEDGFLYVLERKSYSVAKINPDSEQVVDRVYFRELRDASGALYEKDYGYGLAEALFMTSTELLIGLDNNGKPVNPMNHWVQRFGLQGREPAIVRLARPAGF